MKAHLTDLLFSIVKKMASDILPTQIILERPKLIEHGDISCNIALILSKKLNKAPRIIAQEIVNLMPTDNIFKKIDIAGAGFLNFYLSQQSQYQIIANVIDKNKDYGKNTSGAKQKIQIEFVSANPTGPLHVGHGRGAAYGDAIGRILKSTGYEVQKEYYINDAGRQIDILTASVFIRIFAGELSGYFPTNAYKGSYIFDIAELFKEKHGANTLIDSKSLIHNLPQDEEKEIDELILRIKKAENDIWYKVKSLALSEVLQTIRTDLENFNVSFDNWFSESSLGNLSDNKSKISMAITSLKNKDLAYEENGAIWLNTSHTGDDKDRVLIRDDGRATYFASDVAYHKDKIDRGFNKLINVWGADHHGYIKRIEASIKGLGFDEEKLDVQLVQFANLFKDGKKVKMSTRSGEFFSLADLINEIGTDAARFYYLSKQADQHLDFDLDLAKADSKENMFYYIQYAHARICSLHKRYMDENSSMPNKADTITDGSYKNCDKLIHEMSKYPYVVSRASISLQPHLIIFYLKDFAHCFHSFYNDNQVFTESKENIEAIIYSLNAAKIILSNGLGLLGIKPIEKM